MANLRLKVMPWPPWPFKRPCESRFEQLGMFARVSQVSVPISAPTPLVDWPCECHLSGWRRAVSLIHGPWVRVQFGVILACDAMWCGAVQCAVRCSAVQCGAVRCVHTHRGACFERTHERGERERERERVQSMNVRVASQRSENEGS